MSVPLPARAVHDAIAVVTCWLDDDRATALNGELPGIRKASW